MFKIKIFYQICMHSKDNFINKDSIVKLKGEISSGTAYTVIGAVKRLENELLELNNLLVYYTEDMEPESIETKETYVDYIDDAKLINSIDFDIIYNLLPRDYFKNTK